MWPFSCMHVIVCSLSFVLAIGTTVAITLDSPVVCVLRMIRNALVHEDPAVLHPRHPLLGTSELVSLVTLVVGVKDTCSQSAAMLTALAKHHSSHDLVYTHPSFYGCDAVPHDAIRLFASSSVVSLPRDASPFAGFLAARRYISTPFALFMHNDVYLMEPHAVGELVGALREHPDAAFAAPHIYERGGNGIVVPHAHQAALCVHGEEGGREGGGGRRRVDYSLDADLLTRRSGYDFRPVIDGYPQTEFMEDHAFMGRTDTYSVFLDEHASFTLEHIDSVLTQRLYGTYPWYVPTARVLFDVDTSLVRWEDVAYLSFKRSALLGERVIAHLSDKWGYRFPTSGMWDYLRYDMLGDGKVFQGTALPTRRVDHAVLYYAWFASIGFTHFDGIPFDTFLHERMLMHRPSDGDENTTERVRVSYSHPNAAASTPPATALNTSLLPECNTTTPTITDLPRLVPSLTTTAFCDSTACGGLVVVTEYGSASACTCFAQGLRPPSNTVLDRMESILYILKLPGRAVKYRKLSRALHETMRKEEGIRAKQDDGTANHSQERHYHVPRFASTSRIVRWAW